MVVVGRFGPPFGIKGWLNVISYTDPATNLVDYRPWFVERDGAWTQLDVNAIRPHRSGFVVQVDDVCDRDVALRYAGRAIGVDDSTLPEADEGEFYWKDLIGLSVVDARGKVLGTVDGLIETGANDVLVVRADGRETLIPFVDAFVSHVDLAARRIDVDWPTDE